MPYIGSDVPYSVKQVKILTKKKTLKVIHQGCNLPMRSICQSDSIFSLHMKYLNEEHILTPDICLG